MIQVFTNALTASFSRNVGRLMSSCGAVLAVSGSGALANPVNIGSYVVHGGLAQSSTFSGITGGPYNRVNVTFNWSYNSGIVTSNAAAFNFNAGSVPGIIAGLTSVTGMAPNANSTTISVNAILSVPISSSTLMTFVRGQLTPSGVDNKANWDNFTLSFSYQRRNFVIPGGVVALGPRGNTGSAFSLIPTGGGSGGQGFNPSVGVYSEDGYLIASNVGARGTNDPGITGLDLPVGTYYTFIGGEGSTFSADQLETVVPTGAVGGLLSGTLGSGDWGGASIGQGAGQWFSFEVVPSPGAGVMLLGGLGVVGVRRRRQTGQES